MGKPSMTNKLFPRSSKIPYIPIRQLEKRKMIGLSRVLKKQILRKSIFLFVVRSPGHVLCVTYQRFVITITYFC